MDNKIDSCLTLDTICRISRELRSRGKIVGFTHGAFDLFHIGHLSVLQESRKKCDFLIVALESDKNIGQYKNIYRPIVSEDSRLEIINSISYSSVAFVNHLPAADSSYEFLYSEIKPHFVSFGRKFNTPEMMKARSRKFGFSLLEVNNGIDESTSRLIDSIVQKHYLEAGLLKENS